MVQTFGAGPAAKVIAENLFNGIGALRNDPAWQILLDNTNEAITNVQAKEIGLVAARSMHKMMEYFWANRAELKKLLPIR